MSGPSHIPATIPAISLERRLLILASKAGDFLDDDKLNNSQRAWLARRLPRVRSEQNADAAA
jgi:hypothetical protein